MDVSSMMNLGVAHHNRGELAEAERQYRMVLEAEPGHESAWNNLGVIHRTRGEPWQAIECLARSLRTKPRHEAALRNMGNALKDLGMREEAALFYRREADLLLGSGRTEDARSSFARALECTPKDECAEYGMVLALWRLGRHSEAVTALEPLLRRMHFAENALRFLAEGRAEAQVVIDSRLLRFCVSPSSPNLGLIACHANGKLYEQHELERCAGELGPGAVIVDVGANVGNHLVYFAKVLDASLIIPIEPLPDAVAQLRRNIDLNDIRCVDGRFLGKGAGARRARYALVKGTDIAQTALTPAPNGEVEVFPLDELDLEVNFIKIDVEGMELEVLKGARNLIARRHPAMLVEVQDANREPVLALMAELGYSVKWEIRHSGGYANMFLCFLPREQPPVARSGRA